MFSGQVELRALLVTSLLVAPTSRRRISALKTAPLQKRASLLFVMFIRDHSKTDSAL
jgi:hypothetical protein